MLCGYPCLNGRPCGFHAPCGVHTDEFRQGKEQEAMNRADRQSKARERQAREAVLPKCGWTTVSGQTCTHPMPCPFHANARKRRAEDEAASELMRKHLRAFEAANTCGFMCRDGKACTNIVPCTGHAVEQGTKECSSTLDGDPFARCRKKVKLGELFCECHKPFPDLGRQAAIYMDQCKRNKEQPRVQQFLTQHYPGKSALVVPIHDFTKYCESLHKKFA